MAKKTSNKSTTKVTRIKAAEGSSDEITTRKAPAKTESKKQAKQKVAKASEPVKSPNALGKFFGYFKGAWFELRQVHWPTRRATWGLTGAVLVFTAFFVIFISLLDALFKFMFEQILG